MRPFANERGDSIFAASQAVSVRGRSVRRPKSRKAAFLSPIPSRSGPNFSAGRAPGAPWQEKQPYFRKSLLAVLGERAVDAQRLEDVLGSVEVAQLILHVGDEVARLRVGEVVPGHRRARIEGVRIADVSEQPASRCGRGDLGELRGGALTLSLDGVAGDAARLGEELLAVGRIAGGLVGGGFHAPRQVLGYVLPEEIMR